MEQTKDERRIPRGRIISDYEDKHDDPDWVPQRGWDNLELVKE